MTRQIIIARAAALLIVALALAGCGNAAPPAKDGIVIAQGVDATTLDPHMHNETTTTNVTAQIFDRLLVRDEAMELQPQLALSVTALDDLTWELKLRAGITFHNGEPFDAAVVKYNLERIIDPAVHSPQAGNLSAIDRVEAVDQYTVKIYTKTPYPILPSRLNLQMVPKEYIETNGLEYFAANPVGTGPYKFVSWTKDEAIVLEANEAYWREPPAIKKVTFRPIPESSTRVAELQTGGVDLIVNVPPHQVETLAAGNGTKVLQTPSGRYIAIFLVTGKGGPLDDPRVRQALNYAVDVPAIINSVLEGHGYPTTQPVTPLDFGYSPGVKGYNYDPEKAKQLLAEAGYPDGFAFRLDVPSGRYVMDKEVAEAVVGQLAAVGVKVDLSINEWGFHVTKILEQKMEEAFLIGWGGDLFDSDSSLYNWFRSGQRSVYYSTPEIDSQLDAARAMMDVAGRESLYRDINAALSEAAACIFLYQQEDLYGVNSRLVWQPRPDELIQVYDMAFE
ncbi:MAG: ABC transporter substrate-binding protein [bacterium]|jgi:peptide/nickel transport system substrate-binding protein